MFALRPTAIKQVRAFEDAAVLGVNLIAPPAPLIAVGHGVFGDLDAFVAQPVQHDRRQLRVVLAQRLVALRSP